MDNQLIVTLFQNLRPVRDGDDWLFVTENPQIAEVAGYTLIVDESIAVYDSNGNGQELSWITA